MLTAAPDMTDPPDLAALRAEHAGQGRVIVGDDTGEVAAALDAAAAGGMEPARLGLWSHVSLLLDGEDIFAGDGLLVSYAAGVMDGDGWVIDQVSGGYEEPTAFRRVLPESTPDEDVMAVVYPPAIPELLRLLAADSDMTVLVEGEAAAPDGGRVWRIRAVASFADLLDDAARALFEGLSDPAGLDGEASAAFGEGGASFSAVFGSLFSLTAEIGEDGRLYALEADLSPLMNEILRSSLGAEDGVEAAMVSMLLNDAEISSTARIVLRDHGDPSISPDKAAPPMLPGAPDPMPLAG